MKANVYFNCGERRYVSICVKSTSMTPFSVTNAVFKLMHGNEEESNGVCKVSEETPTKWVIRALVQPMRPCAEYTLQYEYDIDPEHLIYKVNLMTLKGGASDV